jgi:DeoR/GlpR family transcriptional regulator of sugar metabolism
MLEAGKLANDNIVIVSVGGTFNVKNYSLTGMLTNNFSQSFFPDKAFISCRGVAEKSGLTDASIYEIEVKRNMIKQSRQFILLADYSKFGLTGAIFISNLDEVDCVSTDSKVDREKLKMFEGLKARTIIAE